MSAAWHGGLNGAEQYVNDPTLASSIISAMDYWFSRDFTLPECLDQGGTNACPCGTPGFWNTNWYSNVRFSQSSEPTSSSKTVRIGHTCPYTSRRELLAV